MADGPGLYSRVVAVLKVGLPLVALAMLSALFFGQGETPSDDGLVFSQGDVEALGSGLRIMNPTFTGTTSSNDRFRFTAAQVTPDKAPPERADISELAGEVTLAGGPVITVRAATGDLHIPTQRLDMTGDVELDTSDGYRVRAPKLTLDLKSGSMLAGDRVETEGPLGTIDSGSLRIAPTGDPATGGGDDRRRFSFGNGVRVLYVPPTAE